MPTSRPTSLTVIAWLLIASCAISLIGFIALHGNAATEGIMRQSVLPLSAQYAIGYFGLAVQLVCSIAILKAHAWGRSLYVGWGVIGMVIGFATSPVKLALIPGVLLFAVVVFFLYRPTASAFFARGTLGTRASSA